MTIRMAAWVCIILGTILSNALAADPAATAPASRPTTGAAPASLTGNAEASWPQWRGPNRDGNAPNSPKLLDAWPKDGPPVLWKSDPIPSGTPWATDGGSGSPVVADGRLYVYADIPGNYVVTSKMLTEWGWLEGVPDELATKIEAARVSPKRGRLTGADLDKYIDDFVATLDAADAKKFGDHIRQRIKMGENTAGWWGMTTVVGAGAQDKVYTKYSEWEKINYKGKSFHDKDLINGHGDGGTGGNFIQAAVLRAAQRTDTVFCLDALTGKLLWKKEFPGRSEKNHGWYWFSGGSCTPTIANGKLYVAGSAALYCLSAKDGKEIWKAKTTFTHSSPLVANGMVYVIFGHHADHDVARQIPGDLTAFNADTGEMIWRQPKVWGLYSSPVLWTGADGKQALVCYAWGGPFLVDPQKGYLLCQAAGAKIGPWAEYCTPVISGDTFVVLAGPTLTAFKIDYPKAEKIWSQDCGGDNRGASPSVYQGYAYIFGRGGSGCLDLKTGEVKWKGKSVNNETPCSVIADGKLFAHGNNRLTMYKASPDSPETILGQTPDLSCAYASPAIADGKMYIRGTDCVICYDLAQK